MNLQPTNRLQAHWPGDIEALPIWTQWKSLHLDVYSDLASSSEDLQGCFYLFRLPLEWGGLFSFGHKRKGKELGKGGTDSEVWFHAAAITLPMGWRNAMGVVQHAHRCLMLRAAECLVHPLEPLLPSQELRKDRQVPALVPACPGRDAFYQVYCDDLDVFEAVSKGTRDWKAGELHRFHAAARHVYESVKVPTSRDKAGVREAGARRLGMQIDGVRGLIHPSGERCRDVHSLGRWIMGQTKITKKGIQVLLGLLVHIMQCRREVSSLLHETWAWMTRDTPGAWPAPLPNAVRRELSRLLLCVPLLKINIRRPPSRHITASDACETGGGVCAARHVTEWGAACLRRDLGRVYARGRDRLGVICCGEDLGCTLSALDMLGLEVTAATGWPCSEAGQRLARCCWPQLKLLPREWHMCVEEMLAHLRRHCRLKLVIVSLIIESMTRPLVMARVQTLLHLLQRGRALGWQMDFIIWRPARRTGPAERIVEDMSAMLEERPYFVDERGFSHVDRAWRVWTSWPLKESKVLALRQDHSWGLRAELTSIKPRLPGVTLVESCPAEVLATRGEEDEYYIAGEGLTKTGSRPLTAGELDRVLGYGPLHSVRAAAKGSKHDAADVQALRKRLQGREPGATVTAAVLGAWGHYRGVCPECDDGVLRQRGYPDERAAGARYLACSKPRGFTDTQELTLLIHRGAMHRGSDVRIATGTLLRPDSYPRLSFDISRLRWRVVCAYRRADEHINALELVAVISSLRWRARRHSEHGRRHVHLIDSQVAQAIMTKGRTSSLRLRYLVRRLNALTLALDASPGYAYVHTSANPADAPSRWVRRG
jgi:hypothetical protein